MFKNKYVLGVLIAIAIFGVTAGGGIFVLSRDNHDAQKAELTAGVGSGSASGTSEDGSTTITQDAITGPTISSGVGTSVNSGSGSSSTSNDAAKLLDPTTFAQYDKYKDAQSASFIDLAVGSGTAVTSGSQVAVVYKGWLTNGTLFDATKTGTAGKLQAFGFVEGQHQVISGWEAALAGVKQGGVRLLIIPPAVGYGATATGSIPANSVLIFQVEVVQVK
jgi:FKBP-type peptidyl-prolyl cis-trans isomerase